VASLTKFVFILSLFLLTACESSRQRILAQAVEPNIIVQIRPLNYIRETGRTYGHERAVGLSYYYEKPCRVLVPELTRRTMTVWQHEIRHCREGRWHN